MQYSEYYAAMRDILISVLKKYKSEGKKIAIWGGGLKGNAFLNIVDEKRQYIQAVVDMNEKLHGRRLNTGHLIVSKEYVIENKFDVIFVMNEMFYVDIYFMLEKMEYKGALLDVDYIIKHKCGEKEIYTNNYRKIDLHSDDLFGYKIEDLHSCLLDLLHEFDRICTKYNISYILEAGTALGTYRYNGFVPCDDDIDVAMKRNEYERFLKLAQNELPENMFIQGMKRGSQYPYPYVQLVMDNTCMVRENFKNLKMHFGVHIDIAPLDNVSANVNLQKKQFYKAKKITAIIRKKMIPEYYTGGIWYKNLIINLPYYLLKLVPLVLLRAIQKSIFQKYNKKQTGYIGDLCTHYKKIIAFREDKIFPGVKNVFSDKEYYAPKDIEYYLSIIYDDYKKMSPRENGTIKYNLVDMSLERNYHEED